MQDFLGQLIRNGNLHGAGIGKTAKACSKQLARISCHGTDVGNGIILDD